MKKPYALAILVISILLLAACGRRGQDANAEPEESVPAYYETGYSQLPEGANIQYDDSVRLAETLTYVHFLEDLDYLLYALENNMSAFDVAYWARGMDIAATIANLRSLVLANPDVCLDAFYVSLWDAFFPMRTAATAHFNVISRWEHDTLFNDPNNIYAAAPLAVYSPTAIERLQLPHVIDFYVPRYGWSIDTPTWESLTLFDVDNSPWLQRERRPAEAWEPVPNVVAHSIYEGQVAYLAVNTFNFDFTPDDERSLFAFYRTIYYYQHLIIDLRNNRGGSFQHFQRTVMGPLLDRTLRAEGFVFFSYGYYSSRYAYRANYRGTLLPIGTVSSLASIEAQGARTIQDMLESFDLPQINMADMQRMDYGFRIGGAAMPNTTWFYDRPAFSGQIWLLTGPNMMSAAELSAWFAKDTGFATLVGETTGGSFGGPRTVIALPNSGILVQIDLFYVTDRYGWPLEAGTVPHYFNREGLDALETVLEMIAEGAYVSNGGRV